MNIIFNRIDRLLGKNNPQKESIDMEVWCYCENDLALFEEYYQEPPFNKPVTLTGNITLSEFIKKWCITKKKTEFGINAERDRTYHILRRHDKQINIDKYREMIKKLPRQLKLKIKAIGRLLEVQEAVKIIETEFENIRKKCNIHRKPIIFLPSPVRHKNKKREHTRYRESDLYFAWRHFQRVNEKFNLPNLRPYGEIIGWQTVQVNTNQFVLQPKIRMLSMSHTPCF